jgi:hypothetical protein
MPIIEISFNPNLPVSTQIGDIAWYLDSTSGSAIELGPITNIDYALNIIYIDLIPGTTPPDNTDFIFYQNSPIVSIGSLKGYYADVQFRNDSIGKAELFSIGSEVFESSK